MADIVDPKIKVQAERARNSKDASLVSVQLVSRSTQNAIEELIKLVSHNHRGKNG